jgi:hypothetical protein
LEYLLEYKKIKSKNTQSIIKRFDETRKRKVKMRTQISDYELITFFNNLKEIIQAQKELNHVLHKRITNLENRLEKKERGVIDVVQEK